MWEKGIELCKELVSLYDNEMFDYEKLSWTLVSSNLGRFVIETQTQRSSKANIFRMKL